MHLHTFLAEVNKLLDPTFYFEVGVQYGTSLQQAERARHAWGVDPVPLTSAQRNQRIFPMTSDDFFREVENKVGVPRDPDFYNLPQPIDLGFIDGLHHYEQALRDFVNITKHVHSQSVVIFDDILPRNHGEAAREQCPGDWTGDVWKVTEVLLEACPAELRIIEVNTQPTGTLVVYGFNNRTHPIDADAIFQEAKKYWDAPLPDSVLQRTHAYDPDSVLRELREMRWGTR
jgi:hypothetical protein